MALPVRCDCSTAILATTGPTIPSTVAGTRKSRITTMTVRSSQLIDSGAGMMWPSSALIQRQPSTSSDPSANRGPTARRGSTRSASRPPSTLPRQIPPRMMPITLVQTVSDDPTCRATRRLETSSRIMMQRLLKNARAYGNKRAARPTIPERLPATAIPGSAIVPSLPVETECKRSSVHHIRPDPRPTTGYPPRSRARNKSPARVGLAARRSGKRSSALRGTPAEGEEANLPNLLVRKDADNLVPSPRDHSPERCGNRWGVACAELGINGLKSSGRDWWRGRGHPLCGTKDPGWSLSPGKAGAATGREK